MSCARGCVDPETDLPCIATTGRLCSSCTLTIRLALRSVPDLAVHAAERSDGRLTPGRESTDTTRRALNPELAPPSPGWHLAEEVIQWAYQAALACADANRHRGPFRYKVDGVPARNLTPIIGYILDNLAWYATVVPLETYDETTGWRRKLEKMTGQDDLTHRIKTPCSQCNQRTLIRRDGSDHVECRNRDCRERWHENEFEWFAHVTAG